MTPLPSSQTIGDQHRHNGIWWLKLVGCGMLANAVYALAISAFYRIDPNLLQPYLDISQPLANWVGTWTPALENIAQRLEGKDLAYRKQLVLHIYAFQVLSSSALALALFPLWSKMRLVIDERLVPSLEARAELSRRVRNAAILALIFLFILSFIILWHGHVPALQARRKITHSWEWLPLWTRPVSMS